MSSKLQTRFNDLIQQHRRVRYENQRLKRALVAAVYEYGPLHIKYQSAVQVRDEDQLDINFDRQTGVYTVTLKDHDDDNFGLGSGSEETGLPRGEGDVAGSLPEIQSVSTDSEVREGDQHDSE